MSITPPPYPLVKLRIWLLCLSSRYVTPCIHCDLPQRKGEMGYHGNPSRWEGWGGGVCLIVLVAGPVVVTQKGTESIWGGLRLEEVRCGAGDCGITEIGVGLWHHKRGTNRVREGIRRCESNLQSHRKPLNPLKTRPEYTRAGYIYGKCVL